jgi:signal transduction histidine kinase/ligand-binding sensor domain-containing protein
MNSKIQRSRRISAGVCRRLAPVFAYALITVPVFGLDPHHKLTQYGHTAWRIQDGVFGGVPSAIAQTKDGYIWIGTRAGLVRFDGVRFTAFQPSPKEKLRSPIISSLLAAQDGSLWIGTGSYLAHFKDGDLTSYLDVLGNISNLAQDREGAVWFSRTRTDGQGGGLCRVSGLRIHCYSASEGMPVRAAQTLLDGGAGDWWVCGANTLAHWGDGSSTVYSLQAMTTEERLTGFTSLAKAADGSIWAGAEWQGKGLGLEHLVDGKLVPFVTPGMNSSSLEVDALLFDRDHSLWVGTDGGGVYRIKGMSIDHFGAAEGLSGDSVNGFFEDREGNIWVTTSKGVDKFRDSRIISYSRSEGLARDEVNSVLAAADGTIWVGDVELNTIRGTTISSINQQSGLPGQQVTSLLEDRKRKLWVGVDDKLFVRGQGRFDEIRRADGSAAGTIPLIAEAPDGSVWAAPITMPRELLHIVKYKVTEEVRSPDGLRPFAFAPESNGDLLVSLQSGDLAQYHAGHWNVIPLHRPRATGIVYQFATAPDGGILGATSIGAVGWKDGRVRDLSTDNDLPCNRVYSLVFDSQKTLWLYTACGLLAIVDSELERWWQNPKAKIKLRSFDILDGAQPAPPAFQPQASMSPDGKLWFANGTVLQQIDPLHLSRNPEIPPVHIEEILADKKEYPIQRDLPLPALTRELQINYTALSFAIPQRVKFRYKLEGWENEWQDAGARRQAFYTNLRPATYRFHVIACNDDGLWNDVGDVLSFTIAPAYYQTRWFECLCAVAFAVLLWAIYLLRLKQATSQIQERLGARMEERERIARELHDTLLQGFQGLVLRFQAVMKMLPVEVPARKVMEQVLDRADEVLLESRQSVRDLREQGATGTELSEALTHCGEELAQNHASLFSLTIVGQPKPLAPVVFNESYRIAREALINAFQHSQARKIEVEVTYLESGISLRVRDDGIGIDATTLSKGRAGHWGLFGMRERAQKIAGHVEIWSQNGGGTEIDLRVPAKVAYPGRRNRSLWQRIEGTLTRNQGDRV